MERVKCLLLLLSGMCSLSSCLLRHRYILVNAPKTWYEAQSYCREKCIDLATIDDMEEMENGLEAVQGDQPDVVWIGCRNGLTKGWHWSLSNKDFYKKGERHYFIWGEEKEGLNCVAYQEGKLYSIGCGNNLYPVCFDGKKQGLEQYVLIATEMTWSAARDYCRSHHTDLASVRNEVENQIIREVAGGVRVWVGLFRDLWEWSDQTYSSFRYWKVGIPVWTGPSKICAALLKSESGRWGVLPCEEAHPFLCNCEKGPTLTFIKVRISSHDLQLDPNDPAVNEDILNHIKQQLGKANVTGLKLRWKKQPDGRVFIKEPNQNG